MKKFLAIGAILTIGGLTLAGCPKAEEAGSAVGNAAAGAGAAAKDAAGAVKDGAVGAADAAAGAAGAAIDSAKIKTAILADEGLKDAKIDVKVNDKKVSLTGEVKNQDLKKKAGELAKTAAPEATVINQILVK